MIIRNLHWLIIKLFNRNKLKKWKIMDFEMYLNPENMGLDLKENSIHKQLILDRIREKRATLIMKEFIEPEDIILELGANIGYYVLIESSNLSDKGFIYAIEPGQDNVQLLKKNIKLNNIKNIEIYELAMSDKKGISKLYLNRASNFYSLINDTNTSRYIEVPTNTVDNFLKNKKHITFLRMDIEGYEVEVIKGMKKTLKDKNFKKLFVEIHPHLVPLEKMLNFLKILKNNKFEIKYAISHDNFQRNILGGCKVEKIPISDLMKDERILKRKNAFEVFLERK